MTEEEQAGQNAQQPQTPPAEQSPPPEQPSQPAGEMGSDSKTMAMLCHLGGLAGFIIPFGNIIAPLIIWLMKKDKDKFVDDQGKEALNFQITVMIAALIGVVLTVLVVTMCVGIPIMIAAGIANIVFCIIAAIKANKGEAYRYPVSIRMIK